MSHSLPVGLQDSLVHLLNSAKPPNNAVRASPESGRGVVHLSGPEIASRPGQP